MTFCSNCIFKYVFCFSYFSCLWLRSASSCMLSHWVHWDLKEQLFLRLKRGSIVVKHILSTMKKSESDFILFAFIIQYCDNFKRKQIFLKVAFWIKTSCIRIEPYNWILGQYFSNQLCTSCSMKNDLNRVTRVQVPLKMLLR